ncbi:hypothetical protein FACS1894193_08500 [Bacilli bacterium]|nr:hypothetical protein FACS1894193_08500 [Bacilli bacterium]
MTSLQTIGSSDAILDGNHHSYQDAQGNTQKFEYKWQFTQDFTISGETARKLNARDVTVLPEPWYHNWMIWAGAVLVLLALFFLFFLLGKRRKDDEEEKDSAKKQAKKADKNSEKVAG